jgi:hypothetical protein
VPAAAIGALSDRAQACIADAGGDLREENLAEMVTRIRRCRDCADARTATLAVLSRQLAYAASVTRPRLEACVAGGKSRGDECHRQPRHHEHCRLSTAGSANRPAGAVSRPAGSSWAR